MAAWPLPTATAGTAFQREVWAALRAIPAGETWSYGRLAAHIGMGNVAKLAPAWIYQTGKPAAACSRPAKGWQPSAPSKLRRLVKTPLGVSR